MYGGVCVSMWCVWGCMCVVYGMCVSVCVVYVYYVYICVGYMLLYGKIVEALSFSLSTELKSTGRTDTYLFYKCLIL